MTPQSKAANKDHFHRIAKKSKATIDEWFFRHAASEFESGHHLNLHLFSLLILLRNVGVQRLFEFKK